MMTNETFARRISAIFPYNFKVQHRRWESHPQQEWTTHFEHWCITYTWVPAGAHHQAVSSWRLSFSPDNTSTSFHGNGSELETAITNMKNQMDLQIQRWQQNYSQDTRYWVPNKEL